MKASLIDGLADHHQAVRAFALRLTGDRAMADDIAQETYIRAQTRGHSFRGEAEIKTWLYSIALNLVRDQFRAARRRPQSDCSDEAIVNASVSAESAMLKEEMSDCIAEYLLQLPYPQRDVVTLHDMAELKHSQIAAHLGITVANSRVILHRGRRAFQKILKENCMLSIGSDEIPCERLAPVPGAYNGALVPVENDFA